jgi:hypothetical protein
MCTRLRLICFSPDLHSTHGFLAPFCTSKHFAKRREAHRVFSPLSGGAYGYTPLYMICCMSEKDPQVATLARSMLAHPNVDVDQRATVPPHVGDLSQVTVC